MSGVFTAVLVDDEPLALKRLARLLQETRRVDVSGSFSDPLEALPFISFNKPDLLFLDIEMPGWTGFELLNRVPEPHPLVVFTTAYNQYALQAFDVNSVAYLLKPIEPQQVTRTLSKLERMLRGSEPKPRLDDLLRQLQAALPKQPVFLQRLASRLGDKIEFIDVDLVTHMYARDKLTYAATASKHYCLDQTIIDLEEKLDPKCFCRVHRSTIVNLDYVHELYPWFTGKMLLRLKDESNTELTVARDRVKVLKERLGM